MPGVTARQGAGLYFYGSTLSRVGDEMSVPSLLLFGLAVWGSPREAASAYAALTLAAAVGGPLLGLVLDRTRRPGAVLTACLLLYGGGLAAIVLTGDTLPHPLVLVVAAVTGLFGPSLAAGWSSQLPRVLPGRPRAFSLDVATYNVAGMAGPALAALVATGLSPAAAVVGAVALVVAAAPAAWSLPRADGREVQDGRGLLRTLLQELGEGFRPLVRIPALRGATLGSSVSFVGVGMFVVACPLLGAERFGDPGRGALLITVLAAASLTATVLTARWPLPLPPDQVFLAGTLVQGVGLVLVGLGGGLPGTVVAVALVGLADGPQLAAVFAVRHRDAPTGNRAQVFTTAASLKVASAAVGGALAGALAGSTTTVLLVAALTQFLAVGAAVAGGTPVRPRVTASPSPPT